MGASGEAGGAILDVATTMSTSVTNLTPPPSFACPRPRTTANGIMICKNTSICWWGGGNILEVCV